MFSNGTLRKRAAEMSTTSGKKKSVKNAEPADSSLAQPPPPLIEPTALSSNKIKLI